MWVVCVPILALVLLLSVVLREPVEPVYRGKKLSEWAEQYTLRRSVDEPVSDLWVDLARPQRRQ